MVDLDEVSVDTLQQKLADVDSKTPALRLAVALNYKHGLTQTEIATQYGITRKTVYNWLTRIETDPLDEAIFDGDRPGRPARLSATQQQELAALLEHPPTESGYEGAAWTPEVVQQLIAKEFAVEYSIPHIRRIMRSAGLRPTNTGWVRKSTPRRGPSATE